MTAALTSLVLPNCGTGPCGESLGIDNVLALAERWVRVVSLPEASAEEGSVDMNLELVPVGEGGNEGPPRIETISFHTIFLPDVEGALDDQGDVFLALGVRRIRSDQVVYVLIRDADGSHHFPGPCMSDGEEFLRQRLGGRYETTIDSVIGLTDGRRIATLLDLYPIATGSPHSRASTTLDDSRR